jgi:dihydrofolate synthase/folylpolyglutamate synthase
MAGEYQLPNAALAVATSELLGKKGMKADGCAVREGLRETKWPGRLEEVNAEPRVLLDGAHNVEAIKRLHQELGKNWSYRRLILVIGIMQDKAIKPMLEEILSLAHQVIFTRPKGERSASPAFLFRCGRKLTTHAEIVGDVKEAVRKAMALAGRNDLICVTGSLYTVGEAREMFSLRVEC